MPPTHVAIDVPANGVLSLTRGLFFLRLFVCYAGQRNLRRVGQFYEDGLSTVRFKTIGDPFNGDTQRIKMASRGKQDQHILLFLLSVHQMIREHWSYTDRFRI